MAITQDIIIDGKPVPFKASAATPRLYRARYRRDIFADLQKLADNLSENDEGASTLDQFSLEIFEDIAHIMAQSADPGVPGRIEDWLDQFETFSIYKILPQLLALWGLNVETESEAKKNQPQPTDS